MRRSTFAHKMFATARIAEAVDPTIHRLSRGGPPVRLDDDLSCARKSKRNHLFKMYDRAATSLGIREHDSLNEPTQHVPGEARRQKKDKESVQQNYHVHPHNTTGSCTPFCLLHHTGASADASLHIDTFHQCADGWGVMCTNKNIMSTGSQPSKNIYGIWRGRTERPGSPLHTWRRPRCLLVFPLIRHGPHDHWAGSCTH